MKFVKNRFDGYLDHKASLDPTIIQDTHRIFSFSSYKYWLDKSGGEGVFPGDLGELSLSSSTGPDPPLQAMKSTNNSSNLSKKRSRSSLKDEDYIEGGY